MWIKRKLTRKSLDELAKVMPVLTEDEQRRCIGGTHFYDQNGTFLRTAGPGDNIQIISQRDLNIAMQNSQNDGDYNYNSSNTWGKSVSDSEIESGGVKNILSHITGYSPDYFIITSGLASDGEAFTWHNETYDSYAFMFDMGSWSLKNKTCMQSTMVHENSHISRTQTSVWIGENRAYLDQTDSSQNFLSLPQTYRERVAEEWLKQAEKEADRVNSGVLSDSIKQTIASRCGVTIK